MAEGSWDAEKIKGFSLTTISVADVPHITCRLILINTKPGRASEYLVTAYPNAAKERWTSAGNQKVLTVWPEVVIGILVEDYSEGANKVWSYHPTLRSGLGWRKKRVGAWLGRSKAAVALLRWWAAGNEERRTTKQPVEEGVQDV
jgi:hypothetical protein